jgi:crossover junction endodeoxyribonuclease RusA
MGGFVGKQLVRIEFEIPAPPRELSPNARVHRMKKHSVGKQHKAVVGPIVAEAVRAAGMTRPLTRATVWTLFIVGCNRGRDRDNATGSMKWAFDGFQAAGLINDDRNLKAMPPEFLVDPEKAAFGPRVWVEVEGT